MSDDGLFAEVLALEFGGDPALAHDQDAVGEPDDFRQLGRDDDDRFALGREAFDQRIDFRLGADVDAARRLVEKKDLRSGRDPAAIMAFCWLPPLNSRIGRSICSGRRLTS